MKTAFMNTLRRAFSSLLLTSLVTQMISGETDTINVTHGIVDGETMVSSVGMFELGFFSPGNSRSRYVGMWYKNVTVMTVVWVANREAPLTSTSGVLRVTEPGILVHLNDTNNIIRFVHTPVAQLLDSGNLVVKDANDDRQENYLWSVVTRFTLSQSGVGQRWTWHDVWTDLCQLPKDPEGWVRADWSNGCIRRTNLSCQGDAFLRYSGIKLPDSRHSWSYAGMTLEEYEAECLRNCSCTVYTHLGLSKGSGRLIWFDDLEDIRALSADGQDIYIRVASSELGEILMSLSFVKYEMVISRESLPEIHIALMLMASFGCFGGTNVDPSAWDDKKNPGKSRFLAQKLLEKRVSHGERRNRQSRMLLTLSFKTSQKH
ncbi:UNVERIFIED_CONTAM: G-type lectin S-receptor-like serine/threonine-protein kinase [Sesamum calycinum]|uniref:G-type lectin S-receptor-like serine/threonine-protein kinase n=1 Tax=Sesamum calycinum TaxID=2727403 RepID=A0AAW2Q4M3_9LAMI